MLIEEGIAATGQEANIQSSRPKQPMRITGYQLMDRIEALRERAQTLNGQFLGSLFRFEKDAVTKPDPRELMRDYLECEKKVALLQEAQAAYNVHVSVSVQDETLSLQQAVKLVGSATRIKNNWLAASKDNPDPQCHSHYYYSSTLERSKDMEYAQRVVGKQECLRLSEIAADYAAALKQAIRSGNATEIELDISAELMR